MHHRGNHRRVLATAAAFVVVLVTALAAPAATAQQAAPSTPVTADPAAEPAAPPPPAFDPAELHETMGFQPLSPTRLLDTRVGTGAPAAPLGPGATLDLLVEGAPGMPADGVGAVVLNVTGTQPTATTYLTVWPADEDQPLASNLNLVPGETRPNLVIAPLGDDGSVSIYNNLGSTHVIADAVGWFPTRQAFTPTTPYRVVDTRLPWPGTPIPPGGELVVDVTGIPDVIPEDGIDSVVLNVTGTIPTATTYLTVWPTGESRPLASNLNLEPDQTAPNLVIAKVGDDGTVSIYNNLGDTHVIVDLLGWFDTDVQLSAVGIEPARLLDTRLPWPGTPVPAAGRVDLQVLGEGGVPDHGVGAVVLNVTGTLATNVTYATAFPAGEPLPLASNLNLTPGVTTPNLVIAKVGADGKVSLYNNLGATHFVVDVMGWFPEPINLDAGTAARCELLDPSECLLVWPSDHLTVDDPTTDTGKRLNLSAESLPHNTSGVHIDPTATNRNDGFSPGTMIVARVPGIDLEQTGAPPLGDLTQSVAPGSPMVIIDADTGKRHPFFAELDPDSPIADTRALMLRPVVNFEEGHRYVVALRDLKDSDGEVIPTNPVFGAYRDKVITEVPAVEARRDAMEDIFTILDGAGVAREDLYLAWDFTVASERNLSERMLHIRDDAFGDLGGAAPEFEVTGVVNDPDEDIARQVEGTLQVPLYLTGTGATGSEFNWGAGGLPERNGSITARFSCRIPHAATPADPARISLYGHGLLGSRSEVNAGNVRDFANEHNIVFCATDWIGMSNEDIGTVIGILGDISKFPQLADRVQQGILNTLFLGRLMRHPMGFASHPAFREAGMPLIDTSELFYDSNSQGAIIGGAATAVSQEWTRAVLGVPGMNYSLLLRRSSDWPLYASFLEGSYPDRLDQTLILALIQTQWDRAEANGYAHHMTDDPYPNTPEHQVLLHVAYADFQVSMWAAEIEARTIGARIYQPALAPGRHPDTNPFVGLSPVPGDGFTGSVLVYWDSGTPPPPTVERPPSDGEDPHGKPRAQPAARMQKSAFFDGTFIDVCGGDPCLAP